MERHPDMKQNGIHDVLPGNREDLSTDRAAPNTKELQKLPQFLKILVRSMCAFGIFRIEIVSGKDSTTNKMPKLFQFHAAYCYVVLVAFFAYFLRSITIFFVGENSSDNFAFKVVVSTWLLQTTLNVLIMIKASHPRWGNQQLACKTWDAKVVSMMDCLDVHLNVKKIRRILMTFFVTGCVSVLFNICVIPIILFQNTTFGDTVASVMVGPLPVNNFTKILFCVLNIFQTVAWMLPVVYTVTMCVVVQSGFKVNAMVLGATIDSGKETNTYPTCLYRQRMLHLHITQCLDLIDKDLKYMYANMFFTNIPLACFILYQILQTSMDTLTLTAFVFWLVANVLFVTVVTLAGASVNEAAHSPLDYIYEVGMTGITLEQLGQLNLFTSKLNGDAIGFTVMTFVPVTKELFLTVGGLYITYFFILLQF